MRKSRLSHVMQNLKNDQQFYEVHEFNFIDSKIVQAVKSVESISPTNKPFITNDVILKWKECLVNGKFNILTRRDLKQLSWHTDVALTNEFFICLQSRNIKISKSIGKGLIYSYLTKWKTTSIEGIRAMIEVGLKSDSPSYYEQVEKYVFNIDGAKFFANELLEKEVSVLEYITDKLGITSSTNQFCEAAYDFLITNHYKVLLSNNSKKRKWFFDHILTALTKEQILKCIELVVSENDVPNEDAKEDLKQFVLFYPHLGDPRLPGFEGNWPKNHKVTNLFIEWLSQSDIKFFFELFIVNKNDNQGRKNFWLKYAHLVKGTRVIVSANDQIRFTRQITEMQQKNNNSSLFASIKEKSKDATAFMMDFGNVIIVEFNLENNACYIYDKSASKFPYINRDLFWRESEFSESVLKRRSQAIKCLTHRDGWESNFANIFANYGLRPKTIERRNFR